MVLLDALGFSEPRKAQDMARNGDITYRGKGVVVNPPGGLISKGHSLGATDLAQYAELTWQLRGWANNRLVKSSVALQHSLGLGGAIVITIYRRADGCKNVAMTDAQVAEASGLGCNPAVKAKYVTEEDAAKVRSKKASSDYALGDTQRTINARL
jgi:sterol carrier protein 2